MTRLETLDVCLEEEADLLEIFLDDERPGDLATREVADLAMKARVAGIPLQVHAPLGCSDLAASCLTDTLHLATCLGADVVTMHLSDLLGCVCQPDWRVALFSGILVGIENDPGCGSDPRALVEYLKFCPAFAPVGVTLDVGHTNLWGGEPVEYARRLLDDLEAMRRPIVNVHLHDNDGDEDDHQDLGTGTIDFATLLPMLRNRARCHRYVIERWDGRQDNLARTRAWLDGQAPPT